MAVDTVVFTANNCAVTFADGTGTAVTLTLTNDVSIAIDGLQGRSLSQIVKGERRGNLFALAHGARLYPTITIEFLHNGFVGATSVPGTPFEFALFQGLYAANVSTSNTGTRSVKTIDIRVVLEGTDYGAAADPSIILEDCFLSSHGLLSEGEPSTYSMTFECTGDISGNLAYTVA
jgi:hypothetical protein